MTIRPRRLSRAQIEAFYDDGYLVVSDVFAADEVEALRDAFDRLEAMAQTLDETCMYRGSQFVVERSSGPDAGAALRIHRIVWCGAAEPHLLERGADPRIVEMAADILDTDAVDQLINQAHFKRPGDAVTFEWHQDSRHRRYGTELWDDVDGRGSFVEIITAVDDMGADNGPLQVIPGSGTNGHLETDPETNALPDGAFDPAEAVTIELEAGSVVLLGPYTIHGSASNESDRSRRLFLNGFATPGANHRVYPGEGSGRRLSVN